jgi:hypothetical protein
MKPYIETAFETQSSEMEKWNSNQYKSEIMTYIDKADINKLRKMLDYIKTAV